MPAESLEPDGEVPAPPEPPLRRVARAVVRLGLPLAVLSAVVSVFFGERMRIDHELQLVVAPEARPGEALAVRALLFDRLEDPQGPRLAPAPVELELRAGAVVRGRATLAPSAAGGAEGAITVPSDVSGELALRAVARLGGEPVAAAEATVRAREDAGPAERVGRLAGTLQMSALGPIASASPDVQPPLPFDVRVEGGACVPEETCRVLVWVGRPAAAIRAEPSAAVSPRTAAAAPSTSGIAALEITVHGPEAQAELVARREGAEVARRSFRIPVALATPAPRLRHRILARGDDARLRVETLPGRPAVIVDAFSEGRWLRTGAVPRAHAARGMALPFARLAPGLWQLQVRTDPYGSERAAVRFVYVREHGVPDASVGPRLRDLFARLDAGSAEAPPADDPELVLAWLAAPAEAAIREQPPAISGHPSDLARLAARRRQLRTIAAAAMALGLLVVTIFFFARGVGAADQAHRILEATGDPELASARHRRKTLVAALLIVLTVLSAFFGAAALLVARTHLFA